MTGTIFYNMIEEDPVEITALMSEVLHPRTGEEVSVVECLGITIRDPFNAIPALCRTLVASGIPPWTTIEFVRVNKDDGTEVQCFKPRPLEEWAWRQLSERQDGIRVRKLSRLEQARAILKIIRETLSENAA